MSIPISEIYGPVFQGEGPVAGQASLMVRVGGCDSRCSWCDSMHAVDGRNKQAWRKMTPAEIVAEIKAIARTCPLVTITGGNPALYEEIAEVYALLPIGFRVAVETQGTIWQDWMWSLEHLIVSPKPPSSGNLLSLVDLKGFLTKAHRGDGPQIAVKVPVLDGNDLDYVAGFVDCGFPLYLQPVTLEDDGPIAILDKTRWLWEAVLERGWFHVRVIPALQTLVYGRERGR